MTTSSCKMLKPLTVANYSVTVSPLIVIDARAVEGRIVRVIDNFDETEQAVEDDSNDGGLNIPVTSSVPALRGNRRRARFCM